MGGSLRRKKQARPKIIKKKRGSDKRTKASLLHSGRHIKSAVPDELRAGRTDLQQKLGAE